jgi:hypothetical protein
VEVASTFEAMERLARCRVKGRAEGDGKGALFVGVNGVQRHRCGKSGDGETVNGRRSTQGVTQLIDWYKSITVNI